MSGNNIQYIGPGGLYGNIGDGGNSGVTISTRDRLDYARLGSPGRTPEAEYPDGYLGTQNSRRGDKLLQKIGSMNRRSYVRGVHKGERIDPGDYVWPADWRPDRGLQAVAMGIKQPLASTMPEQRLPRQGNDLAPPPPSGPVGAGDIRTMAELQNLLPPWNNN